MKYTAKEIAAIREHAKELGGIAQGFRIAEKRAVLFPRMSQDFKDQAEQYEALSKEEWSKIA